MKPCGPGGSGARPWKRLEPMTLSAADVHTVARTWLAARSSGELLPTPPFALNDASDAYRIQDAVAQRHGTMDGWKVGAKGPEAAPTCAPLLGGTVLERSDGLGRDILVGRSVGVEVEIAYRFNRGFAADSVVRDEDVLGGISSAHIAVELCASRLAEGAKAAPLWLLADNQMNERLILGPRLASWQTLEPASVATRLAVDGELLVSSVGGYPPRDPLRLVIWLARHCVEHRGGLRSGQIITTGSWTGMPIVSPPAQISAEFAALASLAFKIS